MRKILFLSFPYPYAKFGPSTNCCVRIMKCLIESGKYEVHCCSYGDTYGKKNFEEVPEILLHQIPILDPRRKVCPNFLIHLKLFLKIPIYPFRSLISDYHHYLVCKSILEKEQFDLVVSQCYSEQSLVTGVLLKKHNLAKKLMVIFWDNIYGMVPQKVIPQGFALRRQRKVESWIAKYADILVSLYPIKSFHEKNGDVPLAAEKRVYLGIPSLIKPKSFGVSAYRNMITDGKTNILYSGTIYNTLHLDYLVRLLNETSDAENINIVVFCRGLSEEKKQQLRQVFKGTIQISGWIPINDLLALFPLIDFFVSFPGNPNAICSKVYEFMSYGKPVIIFYEKDEDVNCNVFSRYPASLMVDVRKIVEDNADEVRTFIKQDHVPIPFETTENLFKTDSPTAYLELINNILNQ